MLSSKRIYLLLVCTLTAVIINAQDLIYLNNGVKFDALVKEITTNEIKYKNVNNPDGPTYVISQREVLFIEYKNGTVEVINKNPATVSPKPTTPTAGEKEKEVKKATPLDVYYMNKNSVLINGLALMNADITFMYERDFANGHLSVLALGGYNFNNVTTWPNAYLQQMSNSKKNYDLGLGLNFFPSNRRKAQYFMGIMVKYLNYSFDKEITNVDANGFPTSVSIEKAQGYQLATMFLNGFQVRVTPSFTYKALVGVGQFSSDSDLKYALYGGETNSISLPKMYLGICFGYRF